MTDYTVGDTLHIAFFTKSHSTGVPTVLAGVPVVSAYEDADLTQITAGITLSVDHDGVVGLNMLTMVTTGANGYDSGKDYHLVITTGTVATVSVVGEVVGRFTLGRSAAVASLVTAQLDLDVLTGTDGALLATSQTTGWPANLAASAAQIIKATVDTATNTHTPTTTEFQADTITEATADHYNGRIIIFTSGVLAGQATDITDYVAVGGIGQFATTALTEAPSNNDTFCIV